MLQSESQLENKSTSVEKTGFKELPCTWCKPIMYRSMPCQARAPTPLIYPSPNANHKIKQHRWLHGETALLSSLAASLGACNNDFTLLSGRQDTAR
jgi:hypothetical protein